MAEPETIFSAIETLFSSPWAGRRVLVSNGGTLTLTSGTITTPVAKTFAISDTTNGIVNLNGGTLLTGQISKAAGGGTATLNFAGGVLKAAASDTPSAAATTFLTGLTTANVKDGGAGIRFNFPGVGLFRPISWEEWLTNFDVHQCAFVYEDDDASRPPSNRYHIVKAEEWKELLS